MNQAKKIETDNLRIEKNVIVLDKILLQISNISQVSIEPVPKKKINPIAIVGLILGALGANQRNDDIKILGILFIVVSIAYLIWVCYTNSESGQYLHIYMNSENHFYIYCANENFLKEVMEVIEFCINNQCINKIKIDLNKCKLYNSPIIAGDKNEVN